MHAREVVQALCIEHARVFRRQPGAERGNLPERFLQVVRRNVGELFEFLVGPGKLLGARFKGQLGDFSRLKLLTKKPVQLFHPADGNPNEGENGNGAAPDRNVDPCVEPKRDNFDDNKVRADASARDGGPPWPHEPSGKQDRDNRNGKRGIVACHKKENGLDRKIQPQYAHKDNQGLVFPFDN